MIAAGRIPAGMESRSAEDVLPGHPDRVCDAIAEAVVTKALSREADAVVSVEVAAFRRSVLLTGHVQFGPIGGGVGRMHTPDGFRGADQLEHLVHEQLAAAGFTGVWQHEVEFRTELSTGAMDSDDHAARAFAFDQTVSVGHADPEGPALLPLEVAVARRMKDALAAARAEHADALGPDGKVLVELAVPITTGSVTTAAGGRARLEAIGISIHHLEDVGYPELHRWLVPHLERALADLEAHVDAGAALEVGRLRINGRGAFVFGGLRGDGGLSGKKLVVDHYGPRVPIGGGAICGKDGHQPDRVGALRARQLAVRLARASGRAATVTLGFLPGLEAPDRLGARLADGTHLDAGAIARRIAVPDLSLVGSATDLALADHDWPEVMRSGYFGSGQRWEE